MGTRGPVPERSGQRRRVNQPTTPITKASGARKVPVPKADREWHPVALRWYRSLARSGQAVYYEPSDWAVAYVIAESMSRDLRPQVVGVIQEGRDAGEVVKAEIPLKGASLGAYLRGFAVLMVTEGDRRRLSLELQRGAGEADPDEEAAVADLDAFRNRLTS